MDDDFPVDAETAADLEAAALSRMLGDAMAGEREAHDRLIDDYHRRLHDGHSIPVELQEYFRAFVDGRGPKLRKSQLKDWHKQALVRYWFKRKGETLGCIADDLGVTLNALNVFLVNYRKRLNRK